MNISRFKPWLVLFTCWMTFVVSSAWAQTEEYYTALCIEDESVGFNWENRGWTRVNFKPKKYLVERLEMEELISGRSGNCLWDYNDINKERLYNEDYGCYNIREFGYPFNSFKSELCHEAFGGHDYGGLDNNSRITCDNFNFLPNGAFQTSSIRSIQTPTLYRDSLSVSVGTCSRL